MKRRDFFKAAMMSSVALALTLVRHKTGPELEAPIEIGVDWAVDGGDRGGYLVPKEYTDQIWKAIRETRNVLPTPMETNMLGSRTVNFVDIPGRDGKSFLEFLKGA